MNIGRLRKQIAAGRVRIEIALPHALTEALKDGLTVAELRAAVYEGEMIEDYGERALFMSFTAPDQIPYHIVLEYFPRDTVTTVVTAYIPDTDHWEPGWKQRKKLSRKRK